MKQGDKLEKKYSEARVTAFAIGDKEYTATITLRSTLNVETEMNLERLLSWDMELLGVEMRKENA